MNFKTVNSWPKVRDALCALAQCIKDNTIENNLRYNVETDQLEFYFDDAGIWFPLNNIFVTLNDDQEIGGEKSFVNNIKFGVNNVYSIGDLVNQLLSIYTTSILSNNGLNILANNLNPINFYENDTLSSAEVVATFHAITRNFILQPSGTLQPDLGHRFQLYGNQYISGYTDTPVVTASPTTSYSMTVTPITKLNLSGNLTITFPNHTSGRSTTIRLILTQDATSGRLVTWNNVKFDGGIPPVLSSNANAVDSLRFLWDGTQWMLDGFFPDVR